MLCALVVCLCGCFCVFVVLILFCAVGFGCFVLCVRDCLEVVEWCTVFAAGWGLMSYRFGTIWCGWMEVLCDS